METRNERLSISLEADIEDINIELADLQQISQMKVFFLKNRLNICVMDPVLILKKNLSQL